MSFSTRKLFLITAFLLILAPVAVFSQTNDCQGVCISQQAANQAAENVRVRAALEAKVAALEAKVAASEQNIQEIRNAAAKNEADLKEALKRTEIELAKRTGEVIQLEANAVRWAAIVDVLIKNTRKKSIGLIAM